MLINLLRQDEGWTFIETIIGINIINSTGKVWLIINNKLFFYMDLDAQL